MRTGERRISLVRELTKIHEEVRRTTLSQAMTYYADNPPRGEFVLVVEGATAEESDGRKNERGTGREFGKRTDATGAFSSSGCQRSGSSDRIPQK